MNAETLKISDGTEMQAYVARPVVAPMKGIIVLQEAFGVNDYIRRISTRFSNQGYLAIAPELFHRTSTGFDADYTKKEGVVEQMQALSDNTISVDLKASFDWLIAQGISEKKVAVIGFCMGGRAAFLANATLPLAAAVSFYGGGIAQTLLPRTHELHAPMLFVWGGKDTHILSEHTRAVADVSTAAGKPFIEVTFSEAGHGFACDARDAYHAPSAREAWALTDAFLEEHLI
ncbi:dienelactone hydrolase family protein [Candidatus Kaiserbacteria bacterium]|nr:dienelactone hydrolase family protein [Candidatus Kaiserbacteria bacterium]